MTTTHQKRKTRIAQTRASLLDQISNDLKHIEQASKNKAIASRARSARLMLDTYLLTLPVSYRGFTDT